MLLALARAGLWARQARAVACERRQLAGAITALEINGSSSSGRRADSRIIEEVEAAAVGLCRWYLLHTAPGLTLLQ